MDAGDVFIDADVRDTNVVLWDVGGLGDVKRGFDIRLSDRRVPDFDGHEATEVTRGGLFHPGAKRFMSMSIGTVQTLTSTIRTATPTGVGPDRRTDPSW